MATNNEPQRPNAARKPRGEAIEQTAFMNALENDPVAAMMALADETAADWDANTTGFEGMLGAKPDNGQKPDQMQVLADAQTT